MEAVFSPDVIPAMRPALGPVLMDEAGQLWVSAFRATTHAWDQEHAWHVLDAAGHPLARIVLPPRARLVAVRQDRAALIVRDSLDVEHILVLPIGTT